MTTPRRQLQVPKDQKNKPLALIVTETTSTVKAKAKSLEVELKDIKPRETQALLDELFARINDNK